jgi:predicted DNA-binding protein
MGITERVEKLADEQGVPESQVIEEALEKGVESLWDEYVLSEYVEGNIDREEAVDLVGLEKVKRSDREVDVMKDDTEWGLNA